MNGKYMRKAEIRWISHDAKRLEHIREKREKKAKRAAKPPAELHSYVEGDFYDDNGNVVGSYSGVIIYTHAKKESVNDDT